MADVDWFSTEDSGGGGGGGKSGKKNQKRRAKAKKNTLQGESTSFQEPQKDLTEELRERLADAKINNDHALAGKLRKQLWIVQDLTAGVTPRVDPDDRDGQAMLAEYERTGVISLPSNNTTNTAKRVEEEVPKAASPVFFTPVSGGAVIEDKRLKNLNKKLKQIEALKERQKKGEKLEANQLEKIKSEASVRKEIQEIEELISKLSAEIKS